MKYKCIKSWVRHSVGDVVEEYEYNRLPHEIKGGGNFEPLQIPLQVVHDVAINPEVSIPAPIDVADVAVEIQESRNFIDDPEKTELPTIPIIGEERKKKWQNKI